MAEEIKEIKAKTGLIKLETMVTDKAEAKYQPRKTVISNGKVYTIIPSKYHVILTDNDFSSVLFFNENLSEICFSLNKSEALHIAKLIMQELRDA